MESLNPAQKKEYLRRDTAIHVLESKLEVLLAAARIAPKGSTDSVVLWDEVEEIEAAMSHYRKSNALLIEPKFDMKALQKEIQEVKNEHPDWETKLKELNDTKEPFVVGELPEVYARLGIEESDFGKKAEVFDVSDDP